jgi:hypothetical protein
VIANFCVTELRLIAQHVINKNLASRNVFILLAVVRFDVFDDVVVAATLRLVAVQSFPLLSD